MTCGGMWWHAVTRSGGDPYVMRFMYGGVCIIGTWWHAVVRGDTQWHAVTRGGTRWHTVTSGGTR